MATRRTIVWYALLALGVGASTWQWLDGGRHDDADTHGHGKRGDLLLPDGVAGVRAVELHRGGRVVRFERDTDGRWFRHEHGAPAHATAASGSAVDLSAVYAHRHGAQQAGTDHRHDASAEQAARIGQALETFGRTQIERHVARGLRERGADYGLERPALMVFVFGDGSTPLLSLHAGDAVPDGLGRYAGWPQRDEVIVVAGYQIDGLAALLR